MTLDLIEWDTMLREWIEKDTFSQLTKLLSSLTTQIPSFGFYNQSNLSHIFLSTSHAPKAKNSKDHTPTVFPWSFFISAKSRPRLGAGYTILF